MHVEKVGRTTGRTSGQIDDIAVDFRVQYEMGTVLFINQIVIRNEPGNFCDRGDSGAVIVDCDFRRATGLLFAASKYAYGIANDLSDVLAKLNVTLVT
jgi:hypothetical protein